MRWRWASCTQQLFRVRAKFPPVLPYMLWISELNLAVVEMDWLEAVGSLQEDEESSQTAEVEDVLGAEAKGSLQHQQANCLTIIAAKVCRAQPCFLSHTSMTYGE